MRRMVASLVISVMAGSFLAPIAFGGTRNDSPACCRRTGKHHCMGTATQDSQEEEKVFKSDVKCPMFPAPAMASSRSARGLLIVAQSFYAAIAAHPALWTQVETSYRICWSRSQQK